LIGKFKIVFIDEAQRIPEIGITSKIIVDQFKEVQLILSGSSAFDLMEKTQEPLTGRKWSFNLWPVSWQEWQDYSGFVRTEQDLENRMVFGLYPDVLMHPEDQGIILKELVSSYLYKDVLTYARIKKPDVLQNLVYAISLQVGKEVSYNEISSLIGIDQKTVSNYIDILEKAFILFRLNAFSTNQRDEIRTGRKIYFYDNGVRNAVAGLINPLSLRSDIGALWENFLISERTKFLQYHHIPARQYFWRTRQQQEIDYVEEINGQIFGYQIKWNEKRNARFSKTFTSKYNPVNKLINRANFREFLSILTG
jgi:predicted AAA+ superfamily ATPase